MKLNVILNKKNILLFVVSLSMQGGFVSLSGYESKVLQHKTVSALKIIFESDPGAVVRTISAKDNAEKIEKILEINKAKFKGLTAEAEFSVVQRLSDYVVKPVQQFFLDLYNYKGVLGPLVKESLGSKFEDSIFDRFFKVKKGAVETFFRDNVKKIDELVGACRVFAILFGDLEKTLPGVFKGGRDFLNSYSAAKEEQEEEQEEQEEEEQSE